MQIPRTTTSKHYPDFIRESKELKEFKRKESIFPKIGLKNSEKVVGDLTVVFSGTGNKALWDIATMSMRGISSCQSWSGFTIHCQKLVGSMLDPCCGIIYTTTGANTKRGPLMQSRSVVRFVIKGSGKNKHAAILIENTYGAWDKVGPARILFENYIKEKTKNKFPIIHSTRGYGHLGYTIPATKQIKAVKPSFRSYRDSGIKYSVGKTLYNMVKLEELV